ncbi:hypothetical protein QZH41_016652, partial [Actinostola sp. cb2023]
VIECGAPYSLSCTTATISAILCVITIPGNLLICIAMAKDPHHELRSPFNYFVVNLAVADLIVGTITEPAFVVFHCIVGVLAPKADESRAMLLQGQRTNAFLSSWVLILCSYPIMLINYSLACGSCDCTVFIGFFEHFCEEKGQWYSKPRERLWRYDPRPKDGRTVNSVDKEGTGPWSQD